MSLWLLGAFRYCLQDKSVANKVGRVAQFWSARTKPAGAHNKQVYSAVDAYILYVGGIDIGVLIPGLLILDGQEWGKTDTLHLYLGLCVLHTMNNLYREE